jgi:hypothetical protein
MKNFKSSASAAKQQGFSLLTGFLLVIILFGALAFFLAGRGINTSFGTTYANSSKASNLIAQAAYLRTGFDSVILAGTSPASVTFDSTATTGIFNLDTGAATKQQIDPSILAAPSAGVLGYWVFGKDVMQITSVGTPLGDYTVLIGGLKQSICQQLNTTLNGTNIASAAPLLAGTTAATIGAAVTSADPTTDLTVSASVLVPATGDGTPSGCYQTTDGDYVFIHAVYPQ